MSVPISEKLFLYYLQCKYKAFLKRSGKNGVRSEYEQFIDYQNTSYRLCAREHFLQRNQINPQQEAIIAFKDIKKRKLNIATDVVIRNEKYDLIIDAIELVSTPSSQKPIYRPILFLPHNTVTKQDKLMLGFYGSALSFEQKAESIDGKFIMTPRFSTLSLKVQSLLKAVCKIEKEIIRMMDSQSPPPLRLNDHCKSCEFQESCYATAKEYDDLSLLKGLRGKEIDTLNKRGIFTVTQYSYTFRPRRAKKLLIKKIIKHHHALNALAIRTQTIYIAGKLELPSSETRVFLDVEGIPDEKFYYLIGLLIDDCGRITTYSLWADNKSEERII